MAELTPQERLQPALLDRLTDFEPHKKVESRDARVLSRQQLRQAVLRDLAWLFNAQRPSAMECDVQHLPDAARSVLNFGLPPLSGETASTLDVMTLEGGIRQAILDFEPRIDANSLQVEAVLSDRMLDQHNQIQVQIRGNMWAQPVPIEMLLRTQVDLETGEVQVEEVGG